MWKLNPNSQQGGGGGGGGEAKQKKREFVLTVYHWRIVKWTMRSFCPCLISTLGRQHSSTGSNRGDPHRNTATKHPEYWQQTSLLQMGFLREAHFFRSQPTLVWLADTARPKRN